MMTKPTDPNKIIMKNEYYPNGLTTQNLYDYYSDKEVKKNIITECNKRPVILFMSMNPKQTMVVKRKGNDAKDIILNDKEYDTYINGYTVSISVENYTKNTSNIFIIDIDPLNEDVSYSEVKGSVNDLVKFFNLPHRIINTQKGFHVYFRTKEEFNVIRIKELLGERLLEKFSEKYMINYKGSKKNASYPINFDFSPMNNRGSSVVPGALNRNGLKCMDITKTFKTFKLEDSIIKT